MGLTYKLTIRNLLKHKGYSLIMIAGLALGIVASLILFYFVYNETTFEREHLDHKRIYRVLLETPSNSGSSEIIPACDGFLKDKLQTKLPEVEVAARVFGFREFEIEANNKKFIEDSIISVDQEFTNIFTFRFVDKLKEDILAKPNQVIISESEANRIFGNTKIAGEIIKINEEDYTITAVFKDFSNKTHMKKKYYYSFASLTQDEGFLRQQGFSFMCYFKATSETLDENRIISFIKEESNNSLKNFFKIDAYVNSGLQSLDDLHLNSNFKIDLAPSGDKQQVSVFFFVAIFISILAIINYVNISTARSNLRILEVGIKKVVGAERKSIIKQFLAETMILVLISFVFALIMLEIVRPFASALLKIEVPQFFFWGYKLQIYVYSGVALIGIISGIYPSLILSKSKALEAIKYKKSHKKSYMRKALVTFQFVIASVLLTSILVMNSQLNFMLNKDLGVIKENVIVIETISNSIANNVDVLIENIKRNPKVVEAGYSTHEPGMLMTSNPFQGPEKGETFMCDEMRTTPDYLKTIGIKFTRGQVWQNPYNIDARKVIINEAAVKLFGLKNPIGATIHRFGYPFTVVGVTENFNYQSLRFKVKPIIMLYNTYKGMLAVRYNNMTAEDAVKFCESEFRKFDQDYEMSFYFLDQKFDKLYKAEILTRKLLTIASIVAFFIAIIGLIALTSFITEQRRKEIGIRKILGATVSEINFGLLNEFIIYVIIANLIATPIVVFIMNRWLQQYAFKIDLTYIPFIISLILCLIVAIGSVSFQTIKAASDNPINSIKYE
jgi:putative ABC transport system permease protein